MGELHTLKQDHPHSKFLPRKPVFTAPAVRRHLLVYTISGALLLQPFAAGSLLQGQRPVPAAAAAATVAAKLEATGSNIITSGAKRTDYRWTSTRGGQAVSAAVHVITIDLTNPYVSLNTISGNNNRLTKRESVGSMVAKTGAVAGVNADFFDTSSGTEGVPFGAQITSGELVTSPNELKGMYMFGVTADRKPVIDRFDFAGKVTAADGSTFPLRGLNTASYQSEDPKQQSAYSHVNSLYLYTEAWTAAERPATSRSATTPTEALVVDGIVTQIADNSTLPDQPPANGFILRGHGTAAQYIRDHLPVGTAVTADYKLVSETSGQTYGEDAFQMMVGGHTILVNDGQPASFSRSVSGIDGVSGRARTAIGYSKDGKTVHLVTVEEGGSNDGMTLGEFQRLLADLGVWKAVNLDGGGSTTMIDRPLGDFQTGLTHPTTYGTTQRQVANAVGVFTHAPQGTLKGIAASGKGKLFIGEQTAYALKAYDSYYNPIDPAGLTPQWSVGNPGILSASNGTITALKPGKTSVTVKAGSGSDELPVEVIGADAILSMAVAPSGAASLQPGASFGAKVTVKLKDGGEYTVPAASVTWSFEGFTAAAAGDGTFTIGSVSPGTEVGYAIARYDGFSALLTLAGGGGTEIGWENFEMPAFAPVFKGSKAAVAGSAQLVTGLPGRENGQALQLTYDFTQDTGIKAAYALLGESGQAVSGTPAGMAVDVYGDGSLNMLRAQVTDAAGKTHMVEFAKQIDWTGWKRVTADFGSYGMKFPVTVKSFYVATAAEGQDERAMTGSVAFDNAAMLVAQDPAAVPGGAAVTLVIGRKSAVVGGNAVPLDVAPLVLNGTTYLPLRFVADTMKGKVGWDQAAKRATVLRAGKLLDMTLGSKEFVLNGERRTAEVAPIVRSGRTLVPVRLVSEQLGLKVGWDQKTKTITIS